MYRRRSALKFAVSLGIVYMGPVNGIHRAAVGPFCNGGWEVSLSFRPPDPPESCGREFYSMRPIIPCALMRLPLQATVVFPLLVSGELVFRTGGGKMV